MLPIMLPFFVIHCHDASINALPLSSEKMSEVILELRQKLHQELSCKGKVELKRCKKSSSGRVNVSLVAVLQWKVHDAISAILLLMPAMEWEMSRDASLMCMHMARAHISHPAIGEWDALSLFVQLTVGVLSHQVATWMCCRVARCSRTR